MLKGILAVISVPTSILRPAGCSRALPEYRRSLRRFYRKPPAPRKPDRPLHQRLRPLRRIRRTRIRLHHLQALICSVVLGDNAHVTDKLYQFASCTGRRFLFFRETCRPLVPRCRHRRCLGSWAAQPVPPHRSSFDPFGHWEVLLQSRPGHPRHSSHGVPQR